jgi:hypothetical protein
MPDSLKKYQMIMAKVNSTAGYKYTDVEFNCKNEAQILGSTIMSNSSLPKHGVKGWKRASEIKDAELFEDGADCRDIVQGKLGDCYLLSAFSVLGNSTIQEMFNATLVNQDWKKSGCFILKFPGGGRSVDESIVIIDDYLPVDENGKPNFASGGVEGLEMWPALLEKAYAKLYGSYSAIQGGKVHMALADMIE